MYNKKKILALIPARGGSKGLPHKNIKLLADKPLIAWSIEEGLKSKYIDKVVVSTDNDKIAEIALKYKAKVPFKRPMELADDSAKTIDVVLHAIEYFDNIDEKYDVLVLLEPTSPLREAKDIDNAIEELINTQDAESIVGIAKVESTHPAFLIKLENKFLRPYLFEDFKVLRRQEIDELFFYEGSLYISYIESLKKRKNFYHKKTLGYIVPKWKSFEVDDITDFVIIEAIINARQNRTIE